jgi:hypothetical protein
MEMHPRVFSIPVITADDSICRSEVNVNRRLINYLSNRRAQCKVNQENDYGKYSVNRQRVVDEPTLFIPQV